MTKSKKGDLLKFDFSELPIIDPDDARELDVRLQLNLYNRFYKQPGDNYEKVVEYFENESANSDFENYINYGIKDKLLISVKPGDWADIKSVFSDKSIRGKHVTKDLMMRVLDKHQKCYLTVFSGNIGAIKFYESCGFFKVCSYDWVDDSNTVCTFDIMVYSKNDDFYGLEDVIEKELDGKNITPTDA